jgi:HEAT repeat protein
MWEDFMKDNKKNVITLILSLAAGITLAEMAIKVDDKTQRYTIEDNGQPVLTYNFGTVPVPEILKGKKYAEPRSDYIHPLYGPNGEILTTDFSPDHPHHRGIYWAWPEVTYNSEKRDLHALQGVFARPVKIHKQSANKDYATITAENVWKWSDDEAIVSEFATITAYHLRNGLRIIDFTFSFEAIKPGITLARRGKTHYGGFNLRMSSFTDLKIVKHSDAIGAYPRRSHAEITGTPPAGKEPTGILILQHPSNPLYPGEWKDFPKLPWLQPTFPSAGTTYELTPGTPLDLAFRVIIRQGDSLETPPEKLFAEYAGDMADPLEKMVSYQYGQNRETLTGTEQALRTADKQQRRQIEKRILNILKKHETSSDFQRWAFRQLQSCGSEACLPVAADYLDQDSWMQALDAIIAVPGEPSLRAMLQSLPNLPDDRRAAVIQSIGVRRDYAAAEVIVDYARNTTAFSAISAIEALGQIGTTDAAKILQTLNVTPTLSSALIDAQLLCAEKLANTKKDTQTAHQIYQSILRDDRVTGSRRTAALIGVTRCSESVTPELMQALKSTDKQIADGAAAALKIIDSSQLTTLRQQFNNLPERSKIIVMTLWGESRLRETEPEILTQLEHPSEELRLAAAKALRTIGSRKSVKPLLVAAADKKSTATEAKISLTQISGDGIFDELAAAAQRADTKTAAPALEVIRDRRDPGYIELMMRIAASKNTAKAAIALDTLRICGTAKELSGLRELLITEEKEVQARAASAIAGICARNKDADIGTIINAEPEITGKAREALIPTLPTIGDEAALSFVCRTPDELAIRALLNWPGSEAVKPLLTILKDKTLADPLNRLAAAALLRLTKNKLSATAQAPILKVALPHVRDETVRAQMETYLTDLGNVNIARGKTVSSSHPWQGNFKPELAVDGNLSTYWSCAHSPSSITVDLGAIAILARIKVVNYYKGKRYYQYRIETSSDNTTWSTAADMSKNTMPATEKGDSFKLNAIKARYVRVTMLKNSANPGMHIIELEVYEGAQQM